MEKAVCACPIQQVVTQIPENIVINYILMINSLPSSSSSSSSSLPTSSSSSSSSSLTRLQEPPSRGVGPNGKFLFTTRKSENTRNPQPYQHHHHNRIHHHQYNPIHTTTTIKREKVGFFPRSGSTALVPRPSPYRALKSSNLSLLETLSSTLVPSSLAENVGKHAQQRR